ncbi:hypothetical protein [Streptomyces uncialis]|nr:hypothetical protein [Streptomyces uncialis]MCX4657916.1 hypothetical protein [Streptomyces uncialis]
MAEDVGEGTDTGCGCRWVQTVKASPFSARQANDFPDHGKDRA